MVQSSEGVKYRRNVTHVKKYHSELFDNIDPVVDQEPAKEPQPEPTQGAERDSRCVDSQPRRSQQERRPPTHLKDYELY